MYKEYAFVNGLWYLTPLSTIFQLLHFFKLRFVPRPSISHLRYRMQMNLWQKWIEQIKYGNQYSWITFLSASCHYGLLAVFFCVSLIRLLLEKVNVSGYFSQWVSIFYECLFYLRFVTLSIFFSLNSKNCWIPVNPGVVPDKTSFIWF